jgi:hypothetical protein
MPTRREELRRPRHCGGITDLRSCYCPVHTWTVYRGGNEEILDLSFIFDSLPFIFRRPALGWQPCFWCWDFALHRIFRLLPLTLRGSSGCCVSCYTNQPRAAFPVFSLHALFPLVSARTARRGLFFVVRSYSRHAQCRGKQKLWWL